MHKELNLSSHCHQSKKVNFAFLLQLGEEFDETTPDGREVTFITFDDTLLIMTLSFPRIGMTLYCHILILSNHNIVIFSYYR